MPAPPDYDYGEDCDMSGQDAYCSHCPFRECEGGMHVPGTDDPCDDCFEDECSTECVHFGANPNVSWA